MYHLTLQKLLVCLLGVLILGSTAVAQRNLQDLINSLPDNQALTPGHENPSAVKVARLHYSGGGDWYWGNSAIPNFLKFAEDNTPFPIDSIERQVTIMRPPGTASSISIARKKSAFASTWPAVDFCSSMIPTAWIAPFANRWPNCFRKGRSYNCRLITPSITVFMISRRDRRKSTNTTETRPGATP